MIESQTFPKTSRLLSPAQFKRVFAQPSKFHSETFSVFAADNQITQARLGLAISKKAVRTAVQRNRIKRVLRENFRKQRTHLSSRDFVIIARRGMADLSNQQLNSIMSKAWNKLGNDAKGN